MTTHITLEGDTLAEILVAIAQAGAGQGTTTGGTGTGTTTGSTGSTGGTTSGGTTGGTPAATDFFPADPGLAPFPSPEGSSVLVIGGKPSGRPYIRDQQAIMYSFGDTPILVPKSDPNNGFGLDLYKVFINGSDPNNFGIIGDQIIICQKKMYWHAGIYWYTLTGTGGATSSTTLPPFFTDSSSSGSTTGGGSTGNAPTMPALPPTISPAPGSSGNILKVGAAETYKTVTAAIAAAQAGDTISVDPTMTVKESFDITKTLRLIGGGTVANPGTAAASFSGGAKIDVTGIPLSHGLGAVVPYTDCIIEGFEITGAGLDEAGRGGTGAIRNNASGNFVVRNCYIHDNQDGIGPMDDPAKPSTWLLDASVLEGNGIGDGGTHNTYFPSVAVTVTLNNVTSIQNPVTASPLRATGQMNNGHAIKTRGNVLTVNGGYYYAADATPFDISNGSTQPCVFSGVTIEKKSGDANHGIIGYGMEGPTNGLAGVKFVGCKFILNCVNPLVQSDPGGKLDFDGTCTWTGNKPVAEAGTVTGLPV